MIEVVFLGTSSMVPTKERNQTGLLISYGSCGILVDCGEGTQRQLKLANISITKIDKILITHWHSDHVLGLPGLIQSLGASEYGKTLEIYGPEGTKSHIEYMFKAFVFDRRINMKITEIGQSKFFDGRDFYLESYLLEHGITTLGYNFVEKDKRKVVMSKIDKFGLPSGPLVGDLQNGKDIVFKGKKIRSDEVTNSVAGKKISIISDTLLCKNCYEMSKNADLLISESTYSSNLEEKSESYNHMTSKQAALIASKSDVKKLILTHFSARYKSTLELNEDARNYFENTECAFDLMRIKLK
ncbi:ribonuclease Z [Candidatus Woesearchaeota archaeon]|nr:ribonuclease Z [Candidatus Woesearchaeota archaeon]